jgi:hypothetical protein
MATFVIPGQSRISAPFQVYHIFFLQNNNFVSKTHQLIQATWCFVNVSLHSSNGASAQCNIWMLEFF